MSDGSTSVAYIICFIVVMGMMGPTFSLDTLEENGTITCKNVSGKVIGKETPITLKVQVNDSVGNVVNIYDVYVSPKAFANYSIGDTHIESICTITDYEYYKEIIEMLLESGVLGE